MKLVPITYKEKAEFTEEDFRKHAGLLADKIVDLPKNRHYQGLWYQIPKDNACGTTGCALGIAALSHLIPGLQFTVHVGICSELDIYPTINGREASWREAGIEFFGEVHDQLFEMGHYSRTEIIHSLRYYAKTGILPL